LPVIDGSQKVVGNAIYERQKAHEKHPVNFQEHERKLHNFGDDKLLSIDSQITSPISRGVDLCNRLFLLFKFSCEGPQGNQYTQFETLYEYDGEWVGNAQYALCPILYNSNFRPIISEKASEKIIALRNGETISELTLVQGPLQPPNYVPGLPYPADVGSIKL